MASLTTAKDRSDRRHQRRKERTVSQPAILTKSPSNTFFQVSLHKIPSSLTQEVKLVFPSLNELLKRKDDPERLLLAIPTLHTTQFEILERNETTELERVRIFTRFAHFSNIFQTLLAKKDPEAFVDYVDIDGGASLTDGGQAVYDECMSMKALLGYKLTNYMGVTMIVHPLQGWKNLTLHTIITYGKRKDIVEILDLMISSYTISNDSDEIGVLGTTRQQEKQHKEEKEEDAVLMKAFD